ncbi:MAG TPA: VTT domain-containing protein [Usitatibacter sp.]|nr:VTT domain-containing protein [Usitatibacter sp.]
MKLERSRLWLGISGLVVAALAMALVVPAQDWTAVLADALEERNRAQALLVFCAAYVIGTLLLIPAWIFPIAAGAAFGPAWGVAAAMASSAIAAMSAFLIARYVVRDHVERAARRSAAFAAVDKAVKREPWKVVAFLRLSPVMPSGAKSYFLGLTCVGPLTYSLASAAGMFPGIALKVYLGHLGRDALSGGPLKWMALAAGIAATLAVAWIVGRRVRRRLGF